MSKKKQQEPEVTYRLSDPLTKEELAVVEEMLRQGKETTNREDIRDEVEARRGTAHGQSQAA